MRAALILVACFVGGVLLLVAGCPTGAAGGDTDAGNGAGSGTQQAVPAFLPDNVTLDIGELPEDADSGTSKLRDGAEVQPEVYENVLRASATIVFRFHTLAGRALALGAAVHDDMNDPNQVHVQGTFHVGAQEAAYKVDFSVFDFDGDGAPDGSGNAVDLPVVVRMWVDRGSGFERFLCARVAQRPSADNIGRGQLYARPYACDSSAAEEVQFFVDYDRTAAEHKWNLAYFTGRMHPRYQVALGLARVDVRDDGQGRVEKTVRAAYDLAENPYGLEAFQSAAHYLLGGPGLLMSATSTRAGSEFSFSDVCLSLADRTRGTEGECDSFDTQDMSLLDMPIGGEADFPAGFPAEPTF